MSSLAGYGPDPLNRRELPAVARFAVARGAVGADRRHRRYESHPARRAPADRPQLRVPPEARSCATQAGMVRRPRDRHRCRERLALPAGAGADRRRHGHRPDAKLPRPLLHGRRGRSESDKGGPIEAKVAFYKDHLHTLWIVAIQQCEVAVEIYGRGEGGVWGRGPCARHPTSWRSGKSASSARWATSTDTRISIRRT